MGLDIVWPVIKQETTKMEWVCAECDDFFQQPRFACQEDLDRHRREAHYKQFEGDINLKEAALQKIKRKIFNSLLNINIKKEKEE